MVTTSRRTEFSFLNSVGFIVGSGTGSRPFGSDVGRGLGGHDGLGGFLHLDVGSRLLFDLDGGDGVVADSVRRKEVKGRQTASEAKISFVILRREVIDMIDMIGKWEPKRSAGKTYGATACPSTSVPTLRKRMKGRQMTNPDQFR